MWPTFLRPLSARHLVLFATTVGQSEEGQKLSVPVPVPVPASEPFANPTAGPS